MSKQSTVDGVISTDELAVRIQQMHDAGAAMTFMGEAPYDTYYNIQDGVLLGSQDPTKPVWFTSLSDGMQVHTPMDALRQSGYGRSVQDEFLTTTTTIDTVTGENTDVLSPRLEADGSYHTPRVFAVIFDLDGINYRLPGPNDGSIHWSPGGYTSVLTEGPNGGLLRNPTHEWIFNGGNPINPGSIIVEMTPDGWKAVRVF